jgi:4-amino-4-deoxy-L-arabinose transferase-like glycosyltransferase
MTSPAVSARPGRPESAPVQSTLHDAVGPGHATGAPGLWRTLPDTVGAVWLLIIGFTLLRLVLAATLPLLPQEAYYWSWSLHPALSYFDHPPLASASIWLTTALFGSTVFGIKCAAVFWSLGWNLLWARLILDMFASHRLAFWSVLALNLTLMYEVYGVGPTPDGPLIFGWVGAIWSIWRLRASGHGRWWYAAGAFAGIALLGKYSAVLLLPIVLLFLMVSADSRHWLRKPQPYVALLLALAIFSPVIVWNAEHQWASFAFQGSHRVGQMAAFKPRYFFNLLGTQVLLVTPFLFVISLVALWRGVRHWGSTDDRARLLLISAAVPLLLFTAVSLRSHVKLNWLAPAWWSLIILAMQQALQSGPRARRMAAGLASSALIVLIAFAFAALPRLPRLPMARDLNSWIGWKATAERVETLSQSIQAEGPQTFVFSPNYKISSLLRYYLPGQPRTYAQDIYGARALQFDYFPHSGDLAGATGLLVVSDQSQSRLDLKRLTPWFDSVELADVVETRAGGRVVRRVEIYRCTNYKGHPRFDLAAPANPDDEVDE